MKEMKLAVTAAIVVAMAGCANPVYVESDESVNLAKYKTYMWVDTRANRDDNSKVTPFAEENIRKTADAELAKRGYMPVATNPDVLVSYDVLVERSTDVQSDPVYTRPFTRVFYNPYLRRWGTMYYPSQFVGYDSYEVPVREGTLTFSLIDANTDKVVWQGWTTKQLDNSKVSGNDLQKEVRNIFKKL